MSKISSFWKLRAMPSPRFYALAAIVRREFLQRVTSLKSELKCGP